MAAMLSGGQIYGTVAKYWVCISRYSAVLSLLVERTDAATSCNKARFQRTNHRSHRKGCTRDRQDSTFSRYACAQRSRTDSVEALQDSGPRLRTSPASRTILHSGARLEVPGLLDRTTVMQPTGVPGLQITRSLFESPRAFAGVSTLPASKPCQPTEDPLELTERDLWEEDAGMGFNKVPRLKSAAGPTFFSS